MLKKKFLKFVLMVLLAFRYITCFTTLSGSTAQQIHNFLIALTCLIVGFWVAYSLYADSQKEKYKRARRKDLIKKIIKTREELENG